MIMKSLGRVLFNLKTSLSVLLLLGCLGLASAPTANAQLTFTVDTFTNDTVSITFNNSTLLGNTAPTNFPTRLFLVDSDNSGNKSWVDDSVGLFGLTNYSGFGQVGSVPINSITAANGNLADVLVFIGSQSDGMGGVTFLDLVAGTSVTTPFTHTVTQTGLFDTSAVSNWALYWGSPAGDGILQSIGVAAAGNTSIAVPEPSTYAAIFGFLALGGAFLRRRSIRSAQLGNESNKA